jgi:hypothetical protein
LQCGNATAPPVGDELEQQRQCIAVRADGVNAGASLPGQVLGEVRLNLPDAERLMAGALCLGRDVRSACSPVPATGGLP